MEYKEKIMILRKYKESSRLARYYMHELEHYKEIHADDISSSDSKIVEDYKNKIRDMTAVMYTHLMNAESMKSNIFVWCESLKDVNERLVIMYHYINNHTFGWIADEMIFSEKQIKRIHNKAIDNLQEPDFYEKWIKDVL